MAEASQQSATLLKAQTIYPNKEVVRTQRFAYTAEDLVSIYKSVTVRWRDYVLVVACCSGMSAMLALMQYDVEAMFFLGLIALIFLALGITYPYFRMWDIRRSHQNTEKSGQLITQYFKFEPQCFTMVNVNGSTGRIRYDELDRVVPDPELFYFYFGPREFLALPWRAFRSDTDIRQVQKWMENNHVRFTLKHLKVPERY